MRCPRLAELPPPPSGKTGWPWTEESSALPDTMPDGTPWPQVSIVTPSYNQGQFIEETIRSVLLQGYPNLEYIIMDGGSTDNSVEIIRKYEPWLADWVSEKDRGQSHAINKGFEWSSGEILAWLNSDDYYRVRALGIAVQALHWSPGSSLVHSDCDILDDPSGTFRQMRVVDRDVVALIRDGNSICQPTAFFRRSALDQVGLLREDLHMIMDYDLWLRLAQAFPIIHLAGVSLAVFREYPESKTSGSSYRQLPEFLRVLDTIFGDPSLDPAILAVKRRAYGRVYMHYAINEARSGRTFPAGLAWYLKALEHHPKGALPSLLTPLWFLKQAIKQIVTPIAVRS